MGSNLFHYCSYVRCSITAKPFPTQPGFKGKSERQNTAVRLDVPFAITEVFKLKMQVELFQ